VPNYDLLSYMLTVLKMFGNFVFISNASVIYHCIDDVICFDDRADMMMRASANVAVCSGFFYSYSDCENYSVRPNILMMKCSVLWH